MKKFILLFLFVISVSFLFSQSGSFQLNFNGKLQSNGTPVTLQKVNVINLTRGVDTMINIAPFSFQLDYSVYVGINEPAKENKDNFIVHPVIPNPFNNNAEFDIEINESSNLQISLYSAGGKKLAGIERKCGTGINHFTINSSENGLLFLQVSDGKNSRSQKLINIYNSAKKSTEIVCNNSETEKKNHKSAKSTNPFIFFLGDQLQFIGYSSGYANSTIYDSPAADSTYTFEFTNLYYRIIGHKTETSMPCFVDVMFSVEDQYFKGVDNLDNTNFKVSEDGIVVSPSETFRYIMKMNTIPYKLKTVLMLDNSASVANNLNQIKAAAIALVNTISPKQEFAIYCFSDQPVLLQDFTDDVSLLTSKINSITTGYATTNLYGSYIQGVQKWDELFSLNGIEQGFLVVFTDGDDTQASSTLQQAVSARGTKKVYMIGLGQDIDPAHLNSLANPGPYYPVTNISELEQVFQEIQADILQYSNSFYWLNYMTPKRTGLHNLKLEIIGNQNTGTDSYYNSQFNANGFASVFSGVYLNMTPLQLYGIDSVEINNPAPFDLTAVTYWAYQPPSYSWSSSNDNIVTVNPDSLYFNRAQLNFPGIDGGVAYITVTDDANIYSKTLKVIAYISPVVSTSPISDTSFTTATGGGNVTGDGGMLVTERGVCWSNSPNPTTSNSHTSDGTGTGSFISSITGLNTNTTYYVKAYATNSIGTTYGAQMSFTTLATVAPTVTTDAITNITSISATSGGNVTSNGGLTVTARGVCWSTSQNPTTINSHTSNGTGTGSFISNITGLTIGATYYVRAYATNTIGTSYGSEVSFTTVALPTVTTTVASSITSTTAASGGNVSSDGGGIINARGVCWSTSQNPTTANSFTSDGTGTGNFTSSITGLMAVTTYYVKAYATNIAGTSYGNQISFISSSAILPTITTTSASNITPTSAISGGDISSNGGANITARGVCWSTSQNPTTSNSLTSNGTGSGNFTSNITGLTIGTTYYVKAYAANTVGTSYGSQVSFTTISLPTVTTTSASIITSTSGTSGGNITSDGGATITTRGVC
ncbi:MAG: VWA domain-containing protein, partial [Bacteroidetes bacterium]|nr:VWA domain-containing protein [Bacteroidota bacterium]